MNQQLVQEVEKAECNLSRKEIGEAEIEWMCGQNVGHIETLKLSYNSVGPGPMIHFQHTRWSNLIRLYLTQTFVGDRGCKSLSRAALDGLKQLYISRNMINSSGALHLSKCNWKQLECLDLSYNKTTNDSVKPLMRGNWKELQIIWMSFVNLGFGEAMNFFTSEYSKLVCIFIDDVWLEPEKIEQINSAMTQKYSEIGDCFTLRF